MPIYSASIDLDEKTRFELLIIDVMLLVEREPIAMDVLVRSFKDCGYKEKDIRKAVEVLLSRGKLYLDERLRLAAEERNK